MYRRVDKAIFEFREARRMYLIVLYSIGIYLLLQASTFYSTYMMVQLTVTVSKDFTPHFVAKLTLLRAPE